MGRTTTGRDWFLALAYDVRLAVRTLRRDRGFTVVTVATLAVGVGATTAIFSVVKGVLLSPLPYPEADRIVRVSTESLPRTGLAELPFSRPGYWHFAENQRTFETFGGYTEGRRDYLTGENESQEIVIAELSLAALEVLRTEPILGRLPTPEEDLAPRVGVVLISHALWVSRFGSDPSIIGRDIADDWPATVIGVMPEAFDFPSPDVDVWTRSRLDPSARGLGALPGAEDGEHTWLAIGRLLPGVTVEDATSDAERLIGEFGDIGYGPQQLEALFSGRAFVTPIKNEIVGGARLPLTIALGTALFVLLIACGNVASLVLMRAEARARERAVRIALGSGRARLVQYVLVESSVLALAGGIGAIALAYVGTKVLVATSPPSIPRLADVRIDGTILFVSAAASLTIGPLLGLLPALRAGSSKALGMVRGGGGGTTMRTERYRVLSSLVVAQTALVLVLLVGSGLMIRSFQALRSVDPGFDPERVLTFDLTVAIGPDRRPGDFYYPLLERLKELPGVVSVAGTESLPMTGVVREAGTTLGPLQIDDFARGDGELRPNFLVKRTTAGYFRTMGIPIIEGREFTPDDFSPSFTGTAFVISSSVKQKYWPEESALGKRLTWGRLNGPVVGVAGDVHHGALETPPEEIVHTAQIIGRTMSIAVRTEGTPGDLAPAVAAAVAAHDPEVPITRMQTMETIVADSFSRTSFTMTLLLLAGSVALFLGAMGIYGVLSFVAKQQAPEMGLRLALGADPSRVRALVLSRGLGLAALGLACGLAASTLLSGVLESLLFHVSAVDVRTLFGACVVLLIVAAAASALPAERASRTSPAVALRSES